MKAEGLAQIVFADRPREHRRADRLPQAASHPGQRSGRHNLRPAGHRDEEAQPQNRGPVPADGQPLAPRDPIAVPAAPELDHRGRAVADALDQPDGKGGCAKARGDEKRENRKHHLVVRVGGEVCDADADDVAVQPPRRRSSGDLFCQMMSTGSGRNGPPSLSATKAFASTGLPSCTATIRYT